MLCCKKIFKEEKINKSYGNLHMLLTLRTVVGSRNDRGRKRIKHAQRNAIGEINIHAYEYSFVDARKNVIR